MRNNYICVSSIWMSHPMQHQCISNSVSVKYYISEGKRRPEEPLQSTKLASEGGIILRQHVPIFPHWKHYKKNKSEIINYISKVVDKFKIFSPNLIPRGKNQLDYANKLMP